MSVEQINLLQLQGLLPTIEFTAKMALICVAVWYVSLGIGILIEKCKNKILIKGAR